MSKVAATGTALIRHATSGDTFEIEASELDFEIVGTDERQMGPETHYQATVEHADLGTLAWNLWEYPVGAENMQEADVGRHELIENVDVGLVHESDDYDDEDWDHNEETIDLASLQPLLTRLPEQLATLDSMLTRLTEHHGQIGHNHPPSEFRLSLEDADIARIRESIIAVSAELDKPNPETKAAVAPIILAHSRFGDLATKLSNWLKIGGFAVGTGVLAGIGKGAGEQVWSEAPALQLLVHTIQHTLAAWAQALVALL